MKLFVSFGGFLFERKTNKYYLNKWINESIKFVIKELKIKVELILYHFGIILFFAFFQPYYYIIIINSIKICKKNKTIIKYKRLYRWKLSKQGVKYAKVR